MVTQTIGGGNNTKVTTATDCQITTIGVTITSVSTEEGSTITRVETTTVPGEFCSLPFPHPESPTACQSSFGDRRTTFSASKMLDRRSCSPTCVSSLFSLIYRLTSCSWNVQNYANNHVRIHIDDYGSGSAIDLLQHDHSARSDRDKCIYAACRSSSDNHVHSDGSRCNRDGAYALLSLPRWGFWRMMLARQCSNDCSREPLETSSACANKLSRLLRLSLVLEQLRRCVNYPHEAVGCSDRRLGNLRLISAISSQVGD